MYDETGVQTWGAELNVHGDVKNLQGERNVCPFRYPGQYEDGETGLYYNRFRYYDSESGEYVSQDSIRLLGENPNIYAYVNNVNNSIDVLGLKPKVFWSGGQKAKDAAKAYAESIGGEILEMTPQGKAMEEFTKGMDWAEAKPLWNKTSQQFAGSAPSSQKKAFAFVDFTKYRGAQSVWEEFEKPILQKKGIQTEVVDVNKPKTSCH
jgi:RHS repeat-associated protein